MTKNAGAWWICSWVLETLPLRKECAEFGSRWNFTGDALQQWDPQGARALGQLCVAVAIRGVDCGGVTEPQVWFLRAVSNNCAYPVPCLPCLFSWTCYAGLHPVAPFSVFWIEFGFIVTFLVRFYLTNWVSAARIILDCGTSRPCCTLICQWWASSRDPLLNWHHCNPLRINL